MSEKLLPCPFCGKKPLQTFTPAIYCETVGCVLYAKHFTPHGWNTRPTPPASVEALRLDYIVQKKLIHIDIHEGPKNAPTVTPLGSVTLDKLDLVERLSRRLSTLPEAGRELAEAKKLIEFYEAALLKHGIAKDFIRPLSSERKPEPFDDGVPPMDECPPESLHRDTTTPADRKEPGR